MLTRERLQTFENSEKKNTIFNEHPVLTTSYFFSLTAALQFWLQIHASNHQTTADYSSLMKEQQWEYGEKRKIVKKKGGEGGVELGREKPFLLIM